MKWQSILHEVEGGLTKYQLIKPTYGISTIASAFDIELPAELVAFYKETDGIIERMGEEKIGDVIWSTEKVVRENKMYRTDQSFKSLYMPFDSLLFIGEAGNGDLFGYSIQENKIRRTDIYTWNHEDDSRAWIAPSLDTFFRWWANGIIKL